MSAENITSEKSTVLERVDTILLNSLEAIMNALVHSSRTQLLVGIGMVVILGHTGTHLAEIHKKRINGERYIQQRNEAIAAIQKKIRI